MREVLLEKNLDYEFYESKPDTSSIYLESQMNKYWQKRSDSYSGQNIAQFESSKRWAWESFIFNEIDESNPLRILDIGTGPGFFAILSALRGHSVTAVDMNKNMLMEARKNAEKAEALIDFMEVGHTLPFEDESFDLIISRDVTWTLTEPEEQLRHWASKLKKNGTLRYFDAEWYFYLRNSEYKRVWEDSKKRIISEDGFVYTESNKLEDIAISLPMTYKKRPEWDKVYWNKQRGFTFDIKTKLNPFVYNQKEQMQYELFPEFLVTVRRDSK